LNAFSYFVRKKDQYEYLLIDKSKIIDIYEEFETMCLSIEERINILNEQFFSLWCFFDQNEYANKDLSKQTNDFL